MTEETLASLIDEMDHRELKQLRNLISKKLMPQMRLAIPEFVEHLDDPADKQLYQLLYMFDAQSVGFMSEISIVMQSMLRSLMASGLRKYRDPLTIFDVGARTGSGANLLGYLFRDYYPFKVDVTAIDIDRTYLNYSAFENQHLSDYMIKDIFELGDDVCDFVVCSHTIEHLDEPIPFVNKLKGMARFGCIVYCPYNEKDPIPDHRIVGPEVVNAVKPERVFLVDSFWNGYKASHKEENIMMIFSSAAKFDVSNLKLPIRQFNDLQSSSG